MKRILASLAILALVTGIALSDEDDGTDDREVLDRFSGFQVMSLSRAADLVEERFTGKLIAARLVRPHPWERDRGVELVHEMRLLTARRDVLVFRLDARTGAFLDIAGAGLTEARRRPGASPQ